MSMHSINLSCDVGKATRLTADISPHSLTIPIPSAIRTSIDMPAIPPDLPFTGEIPDSWDRIIAAVNSGSYARRYAIGSYKPLTVAGNAYDVTLYMRLVAMDTDILEGGSGTAATTWIAGYAGLQYYMDYSSASGGWRDSDMRSFLQKTVLPSIESNLLDAIKSVKKRHRYTASSGGVATQTTYDKLWIPSLGEIFDDDPWGEGGVRYGVYYDAASRKMLQSVTAHPTSTGYIWWLRSSGSSSSFAAVNASGARTSYKTCSGWAHTALGFCI